MLSTPTRITIVAGAPPPGTILSTLTLHPTQSGTLPYWSGFYPTRGAVPTGYSVVSPDDATLSATVLSRFPDGSASVVVVSGTSAVSAGTASSVRLQAGVVPASTPLTASAIAAVVHDVTVDCGPLGRASLTAFDAPARIWWANDRVICARYRVPVGAHATLEALVDVHAFSSGRAFVEVVVENAKMTTSAPTAPTPASYTARVSLDGTVVATVASSEGPGGAHEPFRAWYASGWLGGDPGISVTHDTASMQAHPLLFRVWKPGGSMAMYASDAYVPWQTGRHPSSDLGGTGDSPQIGPLPQWEVHYLQTGAVEARNAVLASALSILTFGVSYRDAASGAMPSYADVGLRDIAGSGDWPSNGQEPLWEVAHHGAAGLMAFLCRPSPVFIEIAQKISFWNKVWGWSAKPVFGDYYQTRGKAWCVRSQAHCVFLTPDGDPWKVEAREVLHQAAQTIQAFADDPANPLGVVYDWSPSNPYDQDPDARGYQMALWQHHYLLVELHKAANAELLTGAAQATLVRVADWAARQPIRYVNEARAGEWRIAYYKTTVGRDPMTIDALPTWGEQFAWQYSDAPPPPSGPWLIGDHTSTTFASATERLDLAGAYYESYFWAALVAAVERGGVEADTAWGTVIAHLTSLATWSEGFAADPRWGSYPRNKGA